MENDLPAIRLCGSALIDCGRDVNDRVTTHAEDLTVTGNTGFTTTTEIAAITPQWTDQVTGFGHRLESIGKVLKLSADDFDADDIEAALNIDASVESGTV